MPRRRRRRFFADAYDTFFIAADDDAADYADYFRHCLDVAMLMLRHTPIRISICHAARLFTGCCLSPDIFHAYYFRWFYTLCHFIYQLLIRHLFVYFDTPATAIIYFCRRRLRLRRHTPCLLYAAFSPYADAADAAASFAILYYCRFAMMASMIIGCRHYLFSSELPMLSLPRHFRAISDY